MNIKECIFLVFFILYLFIFLFITADEGFWFDDLSDWTYVFIF